MVERSFIGNVLAGGKSWWIEWLLLIILENNYSSALRKSSDKEVTFCAEENIDLIS